MDIVSCQNVSKIFQRHTRQKLLREYVSSWIGRNSPSEKFYALRNVSFSIPKGESLGICGHNGAGKSTLLNLITGLGRPDEGSLVVNGRVAALLELGSGFHPDLTGRENVRLNAALLGFSRKRFETLFDTIVEFSGMREFMNEPLRTYSSGMILRLAFSVSINVEPDLLVVDEILAVGDQSFQAKCRERVRQLRDNGTTFICVSHAPETLVEFCDRGIWLDHGQVMLSGPMHEVVEAYQGTRALNA
jgi:ABC-type polysaccharide/polyol phosphate transport system ATPase subunit